MTPSTDSIRLGFSNFAKWQHRRIRLLIKARYWESLAQSRHQTSRAMWVLGLCLTCLGQPQLSSAQSAIETNIRVLLKAPAERWALSLQTLCRAFSGALCCSPTESWPSNRYHTFPQLLGKMTPVGDLWCSRKKSHFTSKRL